MTATATGKTKKTTGIRINTLNPGGPLPATGVDKRNLVPTTTSKGSITIRQIASPTPT